MSLRIRRLDADTPEAELAARWRYDAFFADGGETFETSRDALMDSCGVRTATRSASSPNATASPKACACSCAPRPSPIPGPI